MSAARTPETDGPPVLYERRGPVAHVTKNRPRYRNAQNGAMTYALDDAFHRAADDPEVRVVVLAGAGGHFSAGHDIGTPGRDAHLPFERRAWPAGETDRPARRIAETAADPLGGMDVCAMKDAATRGAVTRDTVTKGANG